MNSVVAYLRHYERANGLPGLSLSQQREYVNQMVRQINSHRNVKAKISTKRIYHIEAIDGQARGWPKLKAVIARAMGDADLGLFAIIPTLDGVQYNVSFLELLAGAAAMDARIFVRSGWRRPSVLDRRTDERLRLDRDYWILSSSNERAAFVEMVSTVRQRNKSLGKTIRAGISEAVSQGVPFGAQCPGAHRFTTEEQGKGGRTTARRRQLSANDPYQQWTPKILAWHRNGWSLGRIAKRLTSDGVRTPDGREISRMLVHRILKREGEISPK